MAGAVCWAFTPVTRWSRHTHTIASSIPSTRGIPHYPLMNCPPSSSCCPHPQQQPGSPLQSMPTSPIAALVLVLHLAVYPASPTQGRVGSLTGCHTVHRHSATRPGEVCQSLKYLVRQGSEACMDENCCYRNHFNLSCTLVFVGAFNYP